VASCARIDSALQAFVDGELNDAERLILEDHVVACDQCAGKLRDHRRLSATLFEAFSEERLSRSLRKPVLENLPEMQPLHAAMEGVNERVKNPFRSVRLFAQYAPVFVLVLVSFLAFNLYQTWPEPVARAESVGAVTFRHGDVSIVEPNAPEVDSVGLEDFVNRGARYTTDAGGALVLSLSGPSTLKADENTSFSVVDDRSIRLDRGRVWFDVGKTSRHFMVSTAAGDVRVMGTIFGVEVAGTRTLVTVLEGTVHVERGNSAAVLRDGFQLSVRSGVAVGEPIEVDAAAALAWADSILPDADALSYFERAFEMRIPAAEVLAEVIFRLDLQAADPLAEWSAANIVVSWRATHSAGHCGYHVYINDHETRENVFKHYIDGGYFDDTAQTQYEIPVPDVIIKGADVLHVRLVPDTTTGDFEVPDLEVRAVEYVR